MVTDNVLNMYNVYGADPESRVAVMVNRGGRRVLTDRAYPLAVSGLGIRTPRAMRGREPTVASTCAVGLSDRQMRSCGLRLWRSAGRATENKKIAVISETQPEPCFDMCSLTGLFSGTHAVLKV
jgi:hypothetical protein